MEFIGIIALLVIGVFVILSVKNSFDSEETKLFRKVWSSKRFSNTQAISQELESHKALRKMFNVDVNDEDKVFQKNTIRLFSAAHDFDKKHPNNMGTIMIDEVAGSLRSLMSHGLVGKDREERKEKIETVLGLVTKFIGMRKVSERMGISYDEMLKSFWDEAKDDEKQEFIKQNADLKADEISELFMLKKMSEVTEQE